MRMSLRGAFACPRTLGVATKQSPAQRGDCFAVTRNDMQTVSLRELQSQTEKELRQLLGRTLLPSVLDKAFKGEL